MIAADAAAIIAGFALTPLTRHDLSLFAVLLACDLATVEFTRRAGEPAGHIRQAFAVWELPLALLLPPFYALLAPAIRVAVTQWRVRKALAYRRVFTAAAQGLSYAACSLVFHALVPALGGIPGDLSGRGGQLWLLAVVAAGALRTVINKLLVITAVNGSDPGTRMWASFLDRETLFGDAAELSIGVLVTYVVPGSLLIALLFLPFVTLLQRSQRHTQLVSATRIDGKTGLLNATTWQAEASAQITRATRTRGTASAAALLMIDIDHFKLYNDTYGHPAGDVVLAEIAATFTRLVREHDLCGRWGGEEFAILLVDTAPDQAAEIAHRLCSAVAQLHFAATAMATAGGPGERVTISIGVATLADGPFRSLDDLVAAADFALYRAKDAGRNTVRLVSDLPPRG